jgi:hypothetical protein
LRGLGTLSPPMSMMRSVLIIGGTITVGLGVIVMWAMASRPPASERTPITYIGTAAEAAPYIELEVLGVATAENFLGDRIRVISGRIHNRSEQTLRSIELRLAFHDYEGMTVREFEGEALGAALPAGESRSYEFRFDDLPREWNTDVPAVNIKRVGY